jgi:hypothetical protein
MSKGDSAAPTEPAATMRLWPDAGQKLRLSRNATYYAARRGEIPGLMRFGRVYRVAIAPFLRALTEDRRSAARTPALLIDERDAARLLLADPNLTEGEVELCQLALGPWPLDFDRRSQLKRALVRLGFRSP